MSRVIKELLSIIENEPDKAHVFFNDNKKKLFSLTNRSLRSAELFKIIHSLQNILVNPPSSKLENLQNAIKFYHDNKEIIGKIDIVQIPNNFLLYQEFTFLNSDLEKQYHQRVIAKAKKLIVNKDNSPKIRMILDHIEYAAQLAEISSAKIDFNPKKSYPQLKLELRALRPAPITVPTLLKDIITVPTPAVLPVFKSGLASVTAPVLAPTIAPVSAPTIPPFSAPENKKHKLVEQGEENNSSLEQSLSKKCKLTIATPTDNVAKVKETKTPDPKPIFSPARSILKHQKKSGTIPFFKQVKFTGNFTEEKKTASSSPNTFRKKRSFDGTVVTATKPKKIANFDVNELKSQEREKRYAYLKGLPKTSSQISVEQAVELFATVIVISSQDKCADFLRELGRFCRQEAVNGPVRANPLLHTAKQLYITAKYWGNKHAEQEIQFTDCTFSSIISLNKRPFSPPTFSAKTVIETLCNVLQEIDAYMIHFPNYPVFNKLVEHFIKDSKIFLPDSKLLIEKLKLGLAELKKAESEKNSGMKMT